MQRLKKKMIIRIPLTIPEFKSHFNSRQSWYFHMRDYVKVLWGTRFFCTYSHGLSLAKFKEGKSVN